MSWSTPLSQFGEALAFQRRIHGADAKGYIHTKNCAHCGKPRGSGHPACSRALQRKHHAEKGA